MNKWEILEELVDEAGSPTCWYLEYDKGFWFISLNPDNTYDCEQMENCEIIKRMNCKTLTSAKRWIASNAWKFEEE